MDTVLFGALNTGDVVEHCMSSFGLFLCVVVLDGGFVGWQKH